MKRRSLLLCALLCASGAAADDGDTLYDVEIVVFRHARPLLSTEQWPAQIIAPRLDGAVAVRTAASGEDAAAAPVERSGDLPLAERVAALQKSSSFEVLVYRAWRQAGLEEQDALPVHVAAGRLARPVEEHHPVPWQPARPAAADPLDGAREADGAASPAPDPAPAAPPEPVALVTHTLDGTVTLVRSRFLHVYTDLVYTVPVDAVVRRAIAPRPAPQVIDASGFTQVVALQPLTMQSFPFRYHRRMRSGEVHYIDHPFIGMLILVTPVESEPGELSD